MNFENLQDLISGIPLIFQYFVPGMVFLYIHNIFLKKKLSPINYWVVSGVITFIEISLFELVMPDRFECTYIIRSAILIICSFVSAIIFGKLNTVNWFKSVTTWLFQKTFTESIWGNIINYKTGCYLNVYLKGKDYYINGTYDCSSEDLEDKWLSLIYFEKRDVTTHKVVPSVENYRDTDKTHIVVRFEDIDHIEVDNNVE